MAKTLYNLATLYYNTQRYTEAEEMYKQALKIRQRLVKDNPKAHESNLAVTLSNLATLYKNTQRLTEAEEMYKQALIIYQRLSKDNPTAYQQNVESLESILKEIKE